MAAIIAQLTRAKRERDKKKTFDSNKCMYQLEPFDTHFDPAKHNRYIIRYKYFLSSLLWFIFTCKYTLRRQKILCIHFCPLINVNIVSFLSCWADFFCQFKSYKLYLTFKIHSRRADVIVRKQELEELEEVFQQIYEEENRKKKPIKFTYKRCILESVFIGKHLIDI